MKVTIILLFNDHLFERNLYLHISSYAAVCYTSLVVLLLFILFLFYFFTHPSRSISFRSLFLSSVNSLLRLHLLFHPASMRFRYLKFTRKVFTDVCKVLLLGKRCVLQCLLQIRSIFEHTDSHYLLNKLFLGDNV
jgi:SHQ1 protein